jgi:hypothetical protein
MSFAAASILSLCVAVWPPTPWTAQDGAPQTPSFAEAYAGGVPFASFFEKVEARHDMWHRNYENGAPSAELVRRVRALPDHFRLLVVAVDSCSDSANTIPYVARLVDEAENLEMRIVHPDLGRWIMEAHRTPDGRAATPTVLVLDEEGERVGCWIERPLPLQEWYAGQGHLSARERLRRKFAWYDADGGASTVGEIVERLEAAAAGRSICPGA